VGITYALDEARKTLARASYSSFASQLAANQAGVVSAIQYSYIYYYAIDQNGNQIAERDEILFELGNAGYVGFDPADPTSTTSVNRVDPDIKSPRTHEIMLGLDRELMPNFSLSGTFTWRRYNDVFWPGDGVLIGVTSADYTQTGTLTGNADPIGNFSVPFYALNDDAVPPGGGRLSTNRAGYHQSYMGFEVSATKRMSNRWMARFGFSTNNHTEHFDDPAVAIEDPTPRVTTTNVWANQDGGQVVSVTTGSGKSSIYMIQPRYQFIANGMWQGPWGLNFGANLLTRQGFGQMFNRSNVPTGDPLSAQKTILLIPEDVAGFRLSTVTSFDVRVEKAFQIGRSNLIFDLDVFNVTNADTVLGREYDLRLNSYNRVREIMNPRILRLGLRMNF
jgi:hypothetical protein